MKTLIGKLNAVVIDNHGTLFVPCIYTMKDGEEPSVIFESADGVSKGCWSVSTLAMITHDNLYLDYGQRWYVTGMTALRQEFAEYITYSKESSSLEDSINSFVERNVPNESTLRGQQIEERRRHLQSL